MLILSQLKSQRLLSQLIYHCALGSTVLYPISVWSADNLPSVSVDNLLKRANTFYAEKKFQAARQAYEQALTLDSGSLSAWRNLGWSYWALGQKDQAYKIWADLLTAFPDDVPTLIALGKANEQDQRLKNAKDYYHRVLTLDPHNSTVHQGLNRVQMAQSRPITQHLAASTAKKTALARVDTLIKNGQYQAAVNILQKEAPTPNNLRRLGLALSHLGKYEQAAAVYKNNAVTATTLSAWRGLGTSLRRQGKHQRAYAIWHDLLDHHPNDLPTLLAISRASEQDGLTQQSLHYYNQILNVAPHDQTAHLAKARLFSKQKDYRAAHRELQSALAQRPFDTTINLALAENLIATEQYEEAEQLLHNLVGQEPSSKNLQLLGATLVKRGKNDEALPYLEKSVHLDADNAKSVMLLARIYWDQHRYNQGIDLLHYFLGKHPDNDVARARLAEHQAAAGDWQHAEQHLRYLADKHPDDNLWKVKLARHLQTEGQSDEAMQLAEQILKTEPDQPKALNLLANNAIFSGDLESGIAWTQRLTHVKPTPERLNQLGKLHVELGSQLDSTGQHTQALQHYAAAHNELQHAAALDPIKSRAPISMVETLRLQKRYPEALQLATKLHAEYPNSTDVIQQLADIYLETGQHKEALAWLKVKQTFMPNHPHLQQAIAKSTFYSGDRSRGLAMLETLVDDSKQSVSIPILLYHGITVSDREDTTPLAKFQEQLASLKKAGYQTISLAQLHGFFEGRGSLPAKPLLITFDDARTDSFQYADPVLADMGFRATMFVPVADVATHGAYTVVWPELKKMFATQRWDMQCHGTEAQHYIPVNAEAHQGRFMANRQWLADRQRLETEDEFTARIDHDLQNCQDTLSRELPEANIFAFAYPYSDQGHRSLSNTPGVFKKNQQLVEKRFQLAFHVDNDYLLTRTSPRFALPRFEVPRGFSGDELVQKLTAIDTKIAASYNLAQLDLEAGNYSHAMTIFNQLEHDGAVAPADKAKFLTTTGKVLKWSNDHAGARSRFEQALALSPNDPAIQMEIDALNKRLKPVFQLSGQYFEDNAQRSYYGISPSVQVPISDKLTLAAYYKYFDFNQAINEKNAGLTTGDQHFQTDVNQFEVQMRYELGARTMLSASAGAADYSDNGSASPAKSGSIFPLGSIKLSSTIGDKLDVSIAADHTYVNTAAAILNNIAFSRIQGAFSLSLLDSLKLSANHAYAYYTDGNRGHRSEVQLTSRVWNNPDVTIGAQFVYADMLKNNPLFWTPDNYIGIAFPLSLKKQWGQSVTTEIAVAPGMGKEAGNDFQFQINSSANINWNLTDNFSVYVSANRYQAASYSNFGATAGISLKY